MFTSFQQRTRLILLTCLGGLVGYTACGPSALAIDYSDVTLVVPGETDEFTFLDYSYSNAGSNASGNHDFVGRLYVPANYDPSKSYGIVVMMHGDGEAGNQPGSIKNLSQVSNDATNVLTNIRNLTLNGETHDYLLLVPQSPGTYWGKEHMFMIKGMLARASSEYNVDTSRFSITGLSKGGQGVFRALMDHTSLYASYSPLTSVNHDGLVPAKTVGVPVWVFSGRQDSMLGSSRSMAKAMIEAQGGSVPSWPSTRDTINDLYLEHGSIRYTEYAAAGHNQSAWNNGAYKDQNYYAWMKAQTSHISALETGDKIAISINNRDENNNAFAVWDDNGALWNSIDKNGMERTLDYVVGFAQTSSGKQTDTHVAVTRAFSNRGTVGTLEIDAFGEDGAWIGNDYWRTNSGTPGEITFFNLSPNAEYDLKLFASIDAAGYLGLYSAGGVSESFDASFNTSSFIYLNGVLTDANGDLILSVTPQGSANRAVLNAFELTAVPEPGTALFCMAGLLFACLRRRF